MHPRQLVLGCVAVSLLTALGTVGVLRWSAAGPDAVVAACRVAAPLGSSAEAAQRTTALFVRSVVLRQDPACGYDLGSARLRSAVDRERWARGDMPVRPFVSRYPPVAYPDASPDPGARQAVYVISRRFGELVQVEPSGVRVPMMVGVAAPDAGQGAFRIVLVLDAEGNWRVDRWWRVRISARDF